MPSAFCPKKHRNRCNSASDEAKRRIDASFDGSLDICESDVSALKSWLPATPVECVGNDGVTGLGSRDQPWPTVCTAIDEKRGVTSKSGSLSAHVSGLRDGPFSVRTGG